jgi:proline dehydrogenase
MLRHASARYIAGPELSDALAVCRKLDQDSYPSTLGFWDSGKDSPQYVAQEYLNGIEAASRQATGCYVSIKLTGLDFDPALEDAVLGAAARKNVRLHFDSQAPDIAGRTFSLLQDRIRKTGNPQMLGCTLPGRWRRSIRDAESVRRMGVCVRVVKGQWQDNEGPEVDLRTGYLNVIDRLSGHPAHVSVATHDPVLAREAIQRLRSRNTPCGLELLLGLPSRHMLKLANSLSAPVRFYVPYGHAWLPYALRQVKRNPRVLFWMAKDVLRLGA